MDSLPYILRTAQKRILNTFLAEVRRQLPDTRGEIPSALIDSLPEFLELLARGLEHLDQPGAQSPLFTEIERSAQGHARQRAHLKNFDLFDVLSEYRIIREVVIRELFDEGPAPMGALRFVNQAIDHRVARTGQYYMEIQEEIRVQSATQEREAKAQVQSALLDAKERLDLALRAGQIGVWEVRFPSNEVIWSERQYQIFGHRPGTKPLHLDDARAAVHPEDLTRLRAAFDRSLKEHQDFSHSYRIIREGQVRWVQSAGRALFDSDQRPVRMLGTTVDITEQKEIASLYQMQVRTLDAILSSLSDLIFMADRDRRISYANAALLKLWGKTLEQVKGKNLRELGYPEHLIRLHESQMDEVFRTGRPVHGENAVKGQDGETIFFENVFVPVLGPGAEVQCVAGAARDSTHRRRSEESLKRAIQNREEVLAVVSHDLRNPLGSILMMASLLGRLPDRSAEFVRDQALKILRAGERMNDMIEDLLNLAKIEAGHFSLSKREVCGCDVVTEAVELSRPRAEEKQIRIEVSGIDQPLQMSCDHSMVLRVISNLLSNAIKFTPEHGLIQLVAQDRGTEVLFSVSDTGPGIAEHHLGNIFDRFWQATKTSHLGTGLGLAIAKGIVEAHGGKIWARSRFGHGAIFYFTLPKAPAHAQAPTGKSQLESA